MTKRYKRTRVSSRQWGALFIAYGWQTKRLSRATVRALIAKGLLEEGPDPDPPQYHLTWKGEMFCTNMMLDGYMNKDSNDSIYPTKGEVSYAVKEEIERRHAMEKQFRRHPSFSDMPYKRTYSTVELDGGVRIRVPVEEVYWDVPGDISPVEKMERKIRGEKFDETEK